MKTSGDRVANLEVIVDNITTSMQSVMAQLQQIQTSLSMNSPNQTPPNPHMGGATQALSREGQGHTFQKAL